jgi:Capsular polysaccharide biosynthesis protein
LIIDVHTHILYDIDDGAKDIAESLKLIKMEIGNGVSTIVLTPHFDPYSDSVDIFTQKRQERYDNLMQHIRDENITLILGSETLYSSLLMYYSTLTPLCISGTRYLLVEFSIDMKFNKEFFAELEKLILKFDIIPILAHAERYIYLKKRISLFEKFKQLDCIVQINADYILHNFEEKFAKQLFKYDYIDMVASDCHDSEIRPPNLNEAISLVDAKYDGYYSKILLGKYKMGMNLQE